MPRTRSRGCIAPGSSGASSRVAFETNAAAFAAEREQLEWQVRELEALKFSADEWPELTAEHARLAHAASLIEAAQLGVEALSEGEGSSLVPAERRHRRRLGSLLEHDPRLREILELLEPAQVQLQEAVHALRHYGERLDLDPQRLREVEQRLDAMHAAARKYRVAAGSAAGRSWRTRSARLRELGDGGDVEALRKLEEAAHAACLAEAKKLSAGRKKAAKKLSEQVTAAMQELAMAGGAFEVALNAAPESRRARAGERRVSGLRAQGHGAAAARQGGLRRRAVAPVASRSRPWRAGWRRCRR